MADCSLCGKPAGLFKSVHPACVQKKEADALAAESEHLRAMRALLQGRGDLGQVVQNARGAMGMERTASLATDVFAQAIAGCVARGIRPTLEELAPFADFRAAFDLNPSFLPNRAWQRFVMLVTLADLGAGKFPDRVDDPGLGFMYERGERIAWVFGGAVYQRDQVVHQRGIYAGVSVRVLPGLYSRIGSPVGGSTIEGLMPVAEGNLVVTDRALWFQGPHGVQRTFLQDISYVQCVANGIVFCGKGKGSRNESYLTGADEGWFAHALVTELIAGSF